MQQKSNCQGICPRAKQSLRFRRWSRKASAVFHSLHTSVGIGQLSTAIIRRLEHKTERLSIALDKSFGRGNTLSSEQELEPLDTFISAEQGLALFQANTCLNLGQRHTTKVLQQKDLSAISQSLCLGQRLNPALKISSFFGLMLSAFLMAKKSLSKDYLND